MCTGRFPGCAEAATLGFGLQRLRRICKHAVIFRAIRGQFHSNPRSVSQCTGRFPGCAEAATLGFGLQRLRRICNDAATDPGCAEAATLGFGLQRLRRIGKHAVSFTVIFTVRRPFPRCAEDPGCAED